jgi:hypothetical protein
MYSLREDTEERGGDAFGGQLLETLRERLRTLKFWRSLFLTNRRGAENTELEEGDAYGGLLYETLRERLRTVEI